MEQKSTPDITILRKAGLTESQAKGYLALVEFGSLSPAELAEKTNESRTNGYMICEKLEQLGLAVRSSNKRVTYTPDNPTKLRQLIVNRQREIKQANDELNAILPSMLSAYRLNTDKPGVLYLEGIESLKIVYDDIIKTGDTLRIFPSYNDRNDPDVAEMIDKQISRQRTAGVKTEVLVRKELLDQFTKLNDNLFEARLGYFNGLDAQIMVYGPNVAISTFASGIVTTIVTNPSIADTFRQLFLGQWDRQHLENKENYLHS